MFGFELFLTWLLARALKEYSPMHINLKEAIYWKKKNKGWDLRLGAEINEIAIFFTSLLNISIFGLIQILVVGLSSLA
jgi:hypothetical protein